MFNEPEYQGVDLEEVMPPGSSRCDGCNEVVPNEDLQNILMSDYSRDGRPEAWCATCRAGWGVA